jgi:hypothetical protein
MYAFLIKATSKETHAAACAAFVSDRNKHSAGWQKKLAFSSKRSHFSPRQFLVPSTQ